MNNLSTLPAESGSSVGKLDHRFASYMGAIAGIALAAAFALRWMNALGTYLNPDEALHYALVNQTSLAAAYKASLTNAHPPLYFVLLYYWRFVGNSELMMRLPSVLAGTGACWMTFRWVSTALGRMAGLTALLLTAFSPVLIALGAEVRGYSILLLWMATSLYFLERAFRDQKISSVVYYSLFLYLAILTHYSALWFVIACGIYVLIRIRSLSRRGRMVWAALQAGAAGIYVWLYVVHISKLHGSPMEAEAMNGWLHALYFQPKAMSVWQFFRTESVGLFQFLFASKAGVYLSFAFMAGVLWMWVAGVVKKRLDLAAFGVFLLLPFALDFAGSVLDLYPYGGTRHCVHLVLFATAGVSFLIAQVLNQKLIPVLILAALILPYWNRHRLPDPQAMDRVAQKKQSMTDAIAYLRASVPSGQPLFTDYQASILLEYYLGRDQPPPPAMDCAGILEEKYGPYRVMVVPGWSATAAQMTSSLNLWRSKCAATPADSFWIFDSGWGLNVLDDLKTVAPRSISQAQHFGVTTSVFNFQLAR